MAIGLLAHDHASLQAFAVGLDAARHFDEAMDLLQHAVEDLGFPLVDYGHSPLARLPGGGFLPVALKTRNFSRGWDRHWSKHNIHDPYYHRSYQGVLPLDWAEVQNDPRLPQPERDCVNYISDTVAGYGLTVPVHLPGGGFAFISAISQSAEGWDHKVRRSRDLVCLIAHYFQNSLVVRRSAAPEPARGELSRREIDCLAWAAQGKTACDIATILGISSETVRVYLKRVNRKLNTLNRAHAIAKASFLGLIDPPKFD